MNLNNNKEFDYKTHIYHFFDDENQATDLLK